MIKTSNQTKNGKAFEFALLCEFFEKLKIFTQIEIEINVPYESAKRSFEYLSEKERSHFRLVASFAANFLIDVEPCLKSIEHHADVLKLEIVADKEGQKGDVRDVLAIRSMHNWEIGISAKNNHRAVKHSRLSNDIDFGEKWLSLGCSTNYFNEITPIFDELATVRSKSKSTQKWSSLGDYHTSVYLPILSAFRKELLRLNSEYPELVAQRLVEYLIGKKDFYKVIKGKNKVEVQAFNLHGTLNLPSTNDKPKAKIPKLKFPNRLIEIVFLENSKTTLLVTLNEGWQISFRIHNASSRVEASLKFDINLVSAPKSLFSNHLFVS